MFLPAQSTVVLFPSLPGDLESETSYRQQLQTWLEWLGSLADQPKQVFAFWDGTEALAANTKFPVKVAPANREAFLALGQTLADQTNSLFAVLWGHGGMQGKTPVFHVRGPRITPADLKIFAGRMPRAEASWVLFFRGSGKFAAEIAAQRRQIVSSESGTMFGSDPIGLPLLQKVLRAGSSNSFVAVAEELGRSVVDWYESRKLARTEEPTLWLPEAEPRLLAPPEKDSTLASVREAKKPTILEAETPKTPDPPSSELPVVWKELVRVDPKKFPEAEAVVLRRRLSYTLASSPAISSEHEEFVQVLTTEGKHAGDFDVAYSPPQEELTILDCEVLRPDGKLVRVEKDDVRESAETPVGDYRTSRRKFFSMPGVAPGAVLHLRYRTVWKEYPMPHISLRLPVSGDTPIVDSTIQVTVPKEAAFHFAFDQSVSLDPVVKQTAHGSSYSWQFKETPAQPAEVLAPPSLQGALLVSTWPDWAAFSDWYGRIIKRADEITPELSEKARELTRDVRDDREKVLALYNYVASLRYVMVPLGVNSHRPHAAANVFKNQFGDCKDKANLFNTLLRSLGLEACLVLVPRFSQAHEAVPGLAFNHAISRVLLGGETLWVDTTDDVCRFGMLPPGDPGRRVLVIDGKSTNLTQLPLPAPKDHRLEVRGELKCVAGGEPAPVSFQAKARGFPDYDLRATAGVAKKHRQNTPLLAAKCRLVSGAFSMAKQSFTAASTLGEDFAWQAEGHGVGLVAGTESKWLMHAPFWLPKEFDLALHPRAMPLFLNQGYPLTLDEDIAITLLAGAQQITLPPVQEDSRGPLRWKIEWTKTGGVGLRAQLHLELAHGELPANDVPDFQKQLRQLLTALAGGASFAAP